VDTEGMPLKWLGEYINHSYFTSNILNEQLTICNNFHMCFWRRAREDVTPINTPPLIRIKTCSESVLDPDHDLILLC
jgi:hypothetical protein